VIGSGEDDRKYRVEYRGADGTRVLARVAGVFPHWSTLIPYASRLLMDSATGAVVLLDDATGETVATYALASGVRRRTDAPRATAAATRCWATGLPQGGSRPQARTRVRRRRAMV
jgi:hypothetical protein